jgi:hypothetical protein
LSKVNLVNSLKEADHDLELLSSSEKNLKSDSIEISTVGSIRQNIINNQVKFMSDIDIEAKNLDEEFWQFNNIDQLLNLKLMVLYVIYIGDGRLKIGYSDRKFLNRSLKHQSSSSTYKKLFFLQIFKISSKQIEKDVHTLLESRRVYHDKEKEIFKLLENEKIVDVLFIIENAIKTLDEKARIDELVEQVKVGEKALLDQKVYYLELLNASAKSLADQNLYYLKQLNEAEKKLLEQKLFYVEEIAKLNDIHSSKMCLLKDFYYQNHNK